MSSPTLGLTKGDQVRALLADEMIWTLGEASPVPEPGASGRPRQFPEWVMILFCCLVTVDTSARKAAAELQERWLEIVAAAKDRYPNDLIRPGFDGCSSGWISQAALA